MPGAQLQEPLAERVGRPLTLSERLQVSQQRHGQVVVAWPSCLDPLRCLLPGRLRPGRELVEALRLVGRLSRRFAGLFLAPALLHGFHPGVLAVGGRLPQLSRRPPRCRWR